MAPSPLGIWALYGMYPVGLLGGVLHTLHLGRYARARVYIGTCTYVWRGSTRPGFRDSGQPIHGPYPWATPYRGLSEALWPPHLGDMAIGIHPIAPTANGLGRGCRRYGSHGVHGVHPSGHPHPIWALRMGHSGRVPRGATPPRAPTPMGAPLCSTL